MKHTILTLLLIAVSAIASAQEGELLTLRLETRFDYMQEHVKDAKINDNSGFKGRYLNIRMDGTIAEGVTYSYRQRLNKPQMHHSSMRQTGLPSHTQEATGASRQASRSSESVVSNMTEHLSTCTSVRNTGTTSLATR